MNWKVGWKELCNVRLCGSLFSLWTTRHRSNQDPPFCLAFSVSKNLQFSVVPFLIAGPGGHKIIVSLIAATGQIKEVAATWKK